MKSLTEIKKEAAEAYAATHPEGKRIDEYEEAKPVE